MIPALWNEGLPELLDKHLRTNMKLEPKSPLSCLMAASGKFSRVWDKVDILRGNNGKTCPAWPDWCFIPFSAWATLTYQLRVGANKTWHEAKSLAIECGVLGTWRYSQGIYRFDDTVYQSLISDSQFTEFPCEILQRLPEWAVYVETPNLHQGRCDGFWAVLDHCEQEGYRLILQLNTRGNITPMILTLGEWSIEEAMRRTFNTHRALGFSEAEISFHSQFGQMLASPCISLLLYLCQDEPDIDDRRLPGSFPSRPQPRKVKGGLRLFPANRVRNWDVGMETGERIRLAWQGGVNGKITPHLRRAHWHGYWNGPRDGERIFSYKWLPPIPVGS